MKPTVFAQWGNALMLVLTAIFMLAPLLVVVLVSFSNSSVFNLPGIMLYMVLRPKETLAELCDALDGRRAFSESDQLPRPRGPRNDLAVQ